MSSIVSNTVGNNIFSQQVVIENGWGYFSTLGANPKTWEEMETGQSFERSWEQLV